MRQFPLTLTDTCNPAWYEHTIREVIRAEVETLADEVRVKDLENVVRLVVAMLSRPVGID